MPLSTGNVHEGWALRSLVDAYKFTLTYPAWCKQKDLSIRDFLEWMQARFDQRGRHQRLLYTCSQAAIHPPSMQPSINGQKVGLESFMQRVEKVRKVIQDLF